MRLRRVVRQGIALVQAYAAATDSAKVEHLRAVGLTPVATLPEAIRLGDRAVDVTLLQGRLSCERRQAAGKAVESEEWRVKSGQRRISGNGTCLTTLVAFFERPPRDRQVA